jgi:hypothetical protein
VARPVRDLLGTVDADRCVACASRLACLYGTRLCLPPSSCVRRLPD